MKMNRITEMKMKRLRKRMFSFIHLCGKTSEKKSHYKRTKRLCENTLIIIQHDADDDWRIIRRRELAQDFKLCGELSIICCVSKTRIWFFVYRYAISNEVSIFSYRQNE